MNRAASVTTELFKDHLKELAAMRQSIQSHKVDDPLNLRDWDARLARIALLLRSVKDSLPKR